MSGKVWSFRPASMSTNGVWSGIVDFDEIESNEKESISREGGVGRFGRQWNGFCVVLHDVGEEPIATATAVMSIPEKFVEAMDGER